jgi:Ca2+-binding RTX toxin-like protein
MRGSLAGVALVAAALAFLGAAPAEEEDVPRCHGRRAEIVGTAGNDVLRGTPERDVIWGGPGDDEISGSLGNDLICGGGGNELVHGGRGNDELYGDAGTDRVIGDLGDDKASGGTGDDDEVAGSLGIDTLNGGPGDFDLVHGDYGYDRMDGGPGNDDIASFATAVAGGKGSGVWASLAAHKARGDGHDRLFRLEDIEGSAFRDTLIGSKSGNRINGGPGDDTLRGGGGPDELVGGQGSDACFGSAGASCGKEASPKATAYVQLDRVKGGGGGLQIVGGEGPDDFTVAFDEAAESFDITAAKGIAIGPGCTRLGSDPKQATCAAGGPARWLIADLGPGNDAFRAEGSLAGAQNVRVAGGFGDDTIKAGPEDDLLQAGPGADKLYGGDGSDGLVGGLPGPTFLYGEGDGDLLAAGGGCAGGSIVGGEGRDDASFAETQAHPGVLYISFLQHKAWIDVLMGKGCKPVHLDPSDEDMEGSFDNDVLIGDSGPNAMLGQPGQDQFFGNGGDDIVDARDGVRDFSIQCGTGFYTHPPKPPKGPRPEPVLHGTPAGRTLTDSFDPAPLLCSDVVVGTPVAGLNNGG